VLVLNPYPQTPFPGKGAILLGLPPLDQARMLAVSRTKPLHDAVAQMADDLYGGATPQSKDALVACQKFCTMQNQQSKQRSTPHFYIIKRFIDSLKRSVGFTLRFCCYIYISSVLRYALKSSPISGCFSATSTHAFIMPSLLPIS